MNPRKDIIFLSLFFPVLLLLLLLLLFSPLLAENSLISKERETTIKVAQDSGDIRSRLSIILGQWRSTIRNNVFVSVGANSSRLLFVNARCKVIFLGCKPSW